MLVHTHLGPGGGGRNQLRARWSGTEPSTQLLSTLGTLLAPQSLHGSWGSLHKCRTPRSQAAVPWSLTLGPGCWEHRGMWTPGWGLGSGWSFLLPCQFPGGRGGASSETAFPLTSESPSGCDRGSGRPVQGQAWPVPVVVSSPYPHPPPAHPQQGQGKGHRENPGGGEQRKGAAPLGLAGVALRKAGSFRATQWSLDFTQSPDCPLYLAAPGEGAPEFLFLCHQSLEKSKGRG